MAQSLSSLLGSLSIDTYRPPPCTSPISGPREELKGRQVVDAPDRPGNYLFTSLCQSALMLGFKDLLFQN